MEWRKLSIREDKKYLQFELWSLELLAVTFICSMKSLERGKRCKLSPVRWPLENKAVGGVLSLAPKKCCTPMFLS